MVMNELGPVLLVAFVSVIIAASFYWSSSKGRSMLEQWAAENGYDIQSQEECWFFRGPFFWTSSKGQKVYKVALRDRDGRVRNGYARCGSYWLGLWSDAVEVRWDD